MLRKSELDLKLIVDHFFGGLFTDVTLVDSCFLIVKHYTTPQPPYYTGEYMSR